MLAIANVTQTGKQLTAQILLLDTSGVSKEMERKNSKQSGIRTRQYSGFFMPGSYVGRATDTIPVRERSPLGFARVLNLPTPSSVARKNVPMGSIKTRKGAYIMSQPNLSVFNFQNNAVRIILDDNNTPSFVASDVALALGYANTSSAIKQHCKGVVKHDTLQTAGGKQTVRIIYEPDVYRLIFGSKLESAAQFQDWVFEDVLPAIRQTGVYQPTKPKIKINKLTNSRRKIRSRDDLSFTRRDSSGRLINWVMPDRDNSWHEHHGIGEIWFNEIVELAQHKPEEAFDALSFVGENLLKDLGRGGHASGFFNRFAQYALASILADIKPEFNFKLPNLSCPPQEGMDYWLSVADKNGSKGA